MEFEDLFAVNRRQWDTNTINLEVKPGYTPFKDRYYTVTKTNKETSHKEIHHLVDIGVVTPIKKSQYGTPIFIITNKEGTVSFITEFGKFRYNEVKMGLCAS